MYYATRHHHHHIIIIIIIIFFLWKILPVRAGSFDERLSSAGLSMSKINKSRPITKTVEFIHMYRHGMCFRIIHFILISTAHALFLTCPPGSISGT